MVRHMGYNNRSLSHSSGPWKKHKYISKIGQGINAVYKYSKNKRDHSVDNENAEAQYKIDRNNRVNESEKQFRREANLKAFQADKEKEAAEKHLHDSIAHPERFGNTERVDRALDNWRLADNRSDSARNEARIWNNRAVDRSLENAYYKKIITQNNSILKRGQALINKLFGKG